MGIFSIFKKKDKEVKSDEKSQKVLVDKKIKKEVKKEDQPKKFKVKKEAKKIQEKEVKKSVKKSKVEKDLTIDEITYGSKKKDKLSKSKKINKHDTKEAYRVLIRPLITEKASFLKVENKYLFEVNKKTNKNEIKKAIYHVYGVWPIKVNIINLQGKDVRYGRTHGFTRAIKKAMVTLKQGDSIEIYEGV